MRHLSSFAGLAAAVSLLAAAPVSANASQPLPFLTSWGGEGTSDGQLQDALNLSVGPTGLVYVADMSNNRIQEFTSDGAFVRAWSVGGPWSVAAVRDGSVYVCTDYNVYKYSSDGAFRFSWGGFGGAPGRFNFAQDVAADADGNVYVADLANHRIQKFDSTGVYLREWGFRGYHAGYPKGITVGADGFVYVSDSGNSTILKYSRDGDSLFAWCLPDGVPGEGNRLGRPAADGSGRVYVPDKVADRIVAYDETGAVQTSWGSMGTGPGQFQVPTCAALGPTGNLYVVDEWNYRVQAFGFVPTSVSPLPAPEAAPRLDPPTPNPMRDLLRVRFTASGGAVISVYDVRGRRVARLSPVAKSGRSGETLWDGRGARGDRSPSGVYYMRLEDGPSITSRRFVLLR